MPFAYLADEHIVPPFGIIDESFDYGKVLDFPSALYVHTGRLNSLNKIEI